MLNKIYVYPKNDIRAKIIPKCRVISAKSAKSAENKVHVKWEEDIIIVPRIIKTRNQTRKKVQMTLITRDKHRHMVKNFKKSTDDAYTRDKHRHMVKNFKKSTDDAYTRDKHRHMVKNFKKSTDDAYTRDKHRHMVKNFKKSTDDAYTRDKHRHIVKNFKSVNIHDVICSSCSNMVDSYALTNLKVVTYM